MRITKKALLLLVAFALAACETRVPPVSTVQPSEPKLNQTVAKKDSMVAASLSVAEETATQVSDSPAKTATLEILKIGRSWAGPYTAEDRAELLALANKIMAGDLAKAKDAISKLTKDGEDSQREIAQLRDAVKNEHENAAKEWKAKLDDLRNQAAAEARKARDRWIMGIFFGGGALLMVGAVVMLVCAAKFAAIYPFLGPKAAFAAGGAGLTLIGLGIAINAIQGLIDRHPYVFAGGCGGAVLLALIAAILVYANHHHATSAK